MTSPLIRPVSVRSYSQTKRHKSTGKYFEIPLADDIEKIGLRSGDKIHLKLRVEHVRNRDIVFIRGTKTSDDGRYDYIIKDRDDRAVRYAVTFPAEWIENREQFKEYENPFYENIESEKQLILEIYESDDPHIRIYDPDDHNYKTGLDIKAPVTGVFHRILSTTRKSRYLDLAKKAPYEGQKFEIIPFDAQHRLLEEIAEDMIEANPFFCYISESEVLNKVKEESSLPRMRVRSLVIKWDPEPRFPLFDERDETRTIFKRHLTKGVRVVLPCKGSFRFSVESLRKDSGTTWATYTEKREDRPSLPPHSGGWQAEYWDTTEEDCYKIFVPVGGLDLEPSSANQESDSL